MSILVDNEINELLSTVPRLATGVPINDFTRATSQIQALSLELTIGEVYLPGADIEELGGVNVPMKMAHLELEYLSKDIVNVGERAEKSRRMLLSRHSCESPQYQ
jgi:hypothetical protein